MRVSEHKVNEGHTSFEIMANLVAAGVVPDTIAMSRAVGCARQYTFYIVGSDGEHLRDTDVGFLLKFCNCWPLDLHCANRLMAWESWRTISVWKHAIRKTQPAPYWVRLADPAGMYHALDAYGKDVLLDWTHGRLYASTASVLGMGSVPQHPVITSTPSPPRQPQRVPHSSPRRGSAKSDHNDGDDDPVDQDD